MTIKTGTFEIINERGLHARASAKFVKLAQTFDSETHVSCNGETVGGTSIMGLMMLAASKGCHVTIACDGSQAEVALEALGALIADRFGEEI
ncbi:MAG: HPr family phosphocarrier protein [Pseudomonadota bacterium]